MSKAATADRRVPETTVRNWLQDADTIHCQGPGADESCPNCWGQNRDGEFTDVPTVAYRPHYDLYGNPECFGGKRS